MDLQNTFVLVLLIIITATVSRLLHRPKHVYLIDFSCCKPGNHHKVTRERLLKQFELHGTCQDCLSFMQRILERCGIGESSYFPSSLLTNPICPSIATAKEEAETVIFDVVDDIFKKTDVKPKEIGLLITNCSLYNPSPSISAMIVNKYGLRGNVKSFNLAGMGCSAGLISIELAKQLLQVHPNSYALIISMENITLHGYLGDNRSMLVTNCLFRMGGAAILLSNRRADRNRAKYALTHTIRTNMGASDRCYNCVIQEEDNDENVGVSLSKDLMMVAGEGLKANITTLGPLVLPVSEQVLFLTVVMLKKFFKMKIKPYLPDFKKASEHFCVHAGGRAVLDEVEKNLRLNPWHMEPSRMTLYRFGNTSSSSLWYELAYTEAKQRVKKGDRIWQIGFGSGFKCNSAVWRAVRTINPSKGNPWMDEISEFPVQVPKTAPFMS